MNTVHTSPASADPAAPDPAPDRAEGCARSGGDEDGVRHERHMAILEELTRVGMDIARAIGRQAVEAAKPAVDGWVAPPDPERDFSALFACISRAVRLTVAFEAKLAEERRKFLDSTESERAAMRAEAARRQAANEARRRVQKKFKVERIAKQAIEAETKDLQERYALGTGLFERLREYERYDELGNRPIGEILARIFRDLGIRPDWQRWEREEWALEEARARAHGSPYGRCWPPETEADQTDESEPPDIEATGRDPP
jgi:hypothetical protein